MASSSSLPSRLMVAVGTYEGVIAGWEKKNDEELDLAFATPVHEGSLRSLCLASGVSAEEPGALLSCGYDEMLRTHDFHKRVTSSGEVRTPSDFGTPTCSSFAPPPSRKPLVDNNNNNNEKPLPSTHCIIGFTNGKLVLYKKRDWSIQHVLNGHDGGVESMAVHPSGKMALSGGQTDGKLKLWDLTKGRLAYVSKISPSSTDRRTGKSRFDPICSLIWSDDGKSYAFSYGNHITVRDVGTGKDLLDLDLPSRVNQLTLMSSNKRSGLYVAAACNDGSLPVLAVQDLDGEDDERRAIMAIEPVDKPIAREERFKCIQSIHDFFVVTANSAGVVSIMNLEGAIRMIMDTPPEEEQIEDNEVDSSDDDEADDDDDEEELAVDIIESARLGTGARITNLIVWSRDDPKDTLIEDINEEEDPCGNEDVAETQNINNEENEQKSKTGGVKRKSNEVEIDDKAIEKARALVYQAKKMKKRKDKKKKKKAKQ